MSKRQFKAQASSERAAGGLQFSNAFGFSSASSAFGKGSALSYLVEPPDVSPFSDPNVKVAVKNLSKKDSTTKSRALEDLQNYFLSLEEEKQPLEDGVLEAWVQLYPRLSIETERRVRQLAHLVLGQVAAVAGRRTAPYLSHIVGAWLAGTYDNDRLVRKAAQEALNRTFATEEKRHNVWKRHLRSVLEHAQDSILHETVQTLSDERVVSPEEAEAKHARVVATGMSLLLGVSTELDSNELDKEQSVLHEILTDGKLWAFASHKDSFVRRTLYALLSREMEIRADFVQSLLPVISVPLVLAALKTDQSGSAWEYSKALTSLTMTFPDVWTIAATSSKWKSTHLAEYLRRGSQGGPSQIWDNHAAIFLHLPKALLPSGVEEGQALLQAMHQGFTRREEPRAHRVAAWKSYFQIGLHILQHFSDEVNHQELVKKCMLPVFEQYLRPSTGSHWMTGDIPATTCVSAFDVIIGLGLSNVSSLLEAEWLRIARMVADDMRTSSPEQSKQFQESQQALAAEGDRWASLNAEVWEMVGGSYPTRQFIRKASLVVLHAALEVMERRKGKPYGVALVLESLLLKNADIILDDDEGFQALSDFFTKELPSLAMSGSFRCLLASLSMFAGSSPDDKHPARQVETRRSAARLALQSIKDAILSEPDSEEKIQAAHALVGFRNATTWDERERDAGLEALVTRNFGLAMQGSPNRWPLISEALVDNGRTLSTASQQSIMTKMLSGLSIREEAPRVLEGFEDLARRHPETIKGLASTNSRFLVDILTLTESPDEKLAARAEVVHTAVETILATDKSAVVKSTVNVIQEGLSGVGAKMMSIPFLVESAQRALSSHPDSRGEMARLLLPDPDIWMTALKPFLSVELNPSLGITDGLGSAVWIISRGHQQAGFSSDVVYDNSGYSVPLRMAMYLTKLLASMDVFEDLGSHGQAGLISLLVLTFQLADDELGLAKANNIWINHVAEVDSDIQTFVSESQKLTIRLLGQTNMSGRYADSGPPPEFISILLQQFKEQAAGLTATSFYKIRALTYLNAESFEIYHQPALELDTIHGLLSNVQRSSEEEILVKASMLRAYRNEDFLSAQALRVFNELMSALTGMEYSHFGLDRLCQLVLFESVAQWESVVEKVAQHRVVLFVKKTIGWLEEGLLEQTSAAAVTLRVLAVLLPVIQDIYGSHWVAICDLIGRVWSADRRDTPLDSQLPLAHASLKLFQEFRKIHDRNDDADEAWQSKIKGLNDGLIRLLSLAPDVYDDDHQPLKTVNDSLARQVALIPTEQLKDVSELYPLMYSTAAGIQHAAFGLLHRFIPVNQEQISIEVAVAKSTARLPEELISLIIETPKSELNPTASWGSRMPSTLQGYLYSWMLVFDHFTGSSFKVKSDYAEQLKEGSHVAGLLDSIFTILGLDRGKPIDASQFDIATYAPDTASSPIRDAQWLAIHLYYLSLKHLPALAKSWWIDLPGRQAAQTIEAWTERFISPLVVSDELDKVNEWIESGLQQDDANMKVRVSRKVKEITAGYEIDEQTMQIMIKLPGAYPLRQATVEGVNRVGVDEKKWRSWLLSTQGVITFSNGSIIDGLTAWRKNVTGALKGQTECAICYSIISADKQLPSKKCNTCKNLFHSGCLYRWFKSSNSSSCPLCRNPFHYG